MHTKYFLLTYRIQDGENQYTQKTCLWLQQDEDIDEAIENYIKNFFGENAYKDGETYFRQDGCQAIRSEGGMEVKHEHLPILQLYGIG